MVVSTGLVRFATLFVSRRARKAVSLELSLVGCKFSVHRFGSIATFL